MYDFAGARDGDDEYIHSKKHIGNQKLNYMHFEHGFSLIELLVTLGIVGIALGIGLMYLAPLLAPVDEAAIELEGVFRHARARALATTSAYRVRPDSATGVRSDTAENCTGGTWTPESTLAFPRQVTMTDTSWSVCFNSRGLASTDLVVTLTHPEYQTRQVEVMLGGAARVVE
jgi:type IV fimbrial biogenesis protein FimT